MRKVVNSLECKQEDFWTESKPNWKPAELLQDCCAVKWGVPLLMWAAEFGTAWSFWSDLWGRLIRREFWTSEVAWSSSYCVPSWPPAHPPSRKTTIPHQLNWNVNESALLWVYSRSPTICVWGPTLCCRALRRDSWWSSYWILKKTMHT